MNERIKELAEQAEKYAYESFDGNIDRNTERFKAKFAELIVKECAEIINRNIMYQVDQSVVSEVFGVARDLIKEHFGVKE